MSKKLASVHPGEILLEDFLKPWLNLQAGYDLDVERDRLARRLVKEVEVLRKVS